ncbi:MAG: hypothetical protein WCI56_14165 [Hyphomicrobiales bacterium]
MRWCALVLMLLLAACARRDGPSNEELKAGWEAQNVFPTNYKADLLAFLRTYLNDPSHVRNPGVSEPQLKTVGPGERFIVCVRYDAKKGNGVYAGEKENMAVYVSGRLDRLVERTRENRDICKDAVYSPFPELSRIAR